MQKLNFAWHKFLKSMKVLIPWTKLRAHRIPCAHRACQTVSAKLQKYIWNEDGEDEYPRTRSCWILRIRFEGHDRTRGLDRGYCTVPHG